MIRSKRFLAATALLAILAGACGSDSITAAGDSGGSAPNPTGPNIIDGSWILTSGTVDEEPMTLIDDYTVTMVITGDEIGGRAACNSYGGFVAIGDTSFAVDALSWTEMGCTPAPMELEGQFLQGISMVDTATRSGDIATLTGPGVSFDFALVPPVPTAELVGSTWILNTIIQGETASSTATNAEPATLRLDADGTFVGSTGCRRVSGDYVVSGSSLQFTSWGADGTCPAELKSQDNSVVSVLEGDISVAIDEIRLTLTVPGGEGLSYRLDQ
jgi:heat shock protein HslJ